MHLQVHYQDMKNTPWVNQFVEKRVNKLDRYLAQSANVLLNVKYKKQNYATSIVIHHSHQQYAFSAEAANLFEALSEVLNKAHRVLGEQKRKVKDKINRRYFSLKKRGDLI
jgi:ribosomal subunit interface protein